MQLEPHGVLGLAGVESDRLFPTAVDCPLCGAPGKLEVRNTEVVQCRVCHFIGDLIELVAAKTDTSHETTLMELELRGLVGFDGEERDQYLEERAYQKTLRELVLKMGKERLKDFLPAAINAVLAKINCQYGGKLISKLVPHVTYLTAKILSEHEIRLPKAAKRVKTWWGKYAALAIPAWNNTAIVGFFLLTVKGANYLPLTDTAVTGNGFGLVPSLSDKATFVVDDPGVALRYTIWSALSSGSYTAFVTPFGLHDTAETYKSGKLMYWSPGNDLRWMLRATETPYASTFLSRECGDFDFTAQFPMEGSFPRFLRTARLSVGAHQAVAEHMLSLPEDELRQKLVGVDIDVNNRAKILSHAQGADAEFISAVLDDTVRSIAIAWNGKMITDTEDGWIADGKVVSNAKIHIDFVRPEGDSGDAVLTGTVTFKKQAHKFREKLSVLSQNPGKWVVGFVVSKTGAIPYVQPSWSKTLLEVAQQFHTPTPIMADQQYGWDDDKLRMPNFVITSSNVYVSQTTMEGPAIALPSPLSDCEWEAFKSPAFCRVALLLTGNIVRTYMGRRGIGFMLKNEPHVVERLASAFKSEIALNPSSDLIDQHSLSPLPLFTQWTGKTLAELFATSDYKNAVVSVDSHTDRLARINPDWIHLTVGSTIDYSALRAIFLLLPRIIRDEVLDPDSDNFYRELADTMHEEVAEECKNHKLAFSALDLDTHNSYKANTAGTRILELVFYGVERGDIRPEIGDNEVVIKQAEFIATTISPIISIPSITELTNALMDARFLTTKKKGKWVISRVAWDLNQSLIGV